MPNLYVDYNTQVTVTTGQQLNITVTTGAQILNVAFVSGPPGRDGTNGSGIASGLYPLYYDSGTNSLGLDTGFLNSNYYPLLSNPSGYTTEFFVTGISGALTDLISASNAGVSAINGLSGLVTLLGTGNITVTTDGQNIIVSGAGGSVEVNLSGYITTGSADLRYYPLNSNPSGYLTGFNSGLYLEKSETGQFASAFALYQTGSNLFALINATSGGVSSLNSLSGALNLTGAGNVTVFINGQTLIISGNTGDYANFATVANLALTGQSLYQISVDISGILQSYINNKYDNSNPSGYITGFNSGDYLLRSETGQFASVTSLFQTGFILNNGITGLSGYLLNLINASSAGVSSINGQSGAINIYGAGNVFVTTSGQNITVSGSGSNGEGIGLTWVLVSGDTNMIANYGYIASGVTGLVTLFLPTTLAEGNMFEITSKSIGWRIAQNNNQTIYMGVEQTTVGTNGYLQSTHQRDSVRIVAVNDYSANVLSSFGNIGIN